MEFVCNHDKCCGCRACENICPQNAIRMVENEKGFLYPVIDKNLCLNCKLCQNVCPGLKDKPEYKPLKIYACKNKNYKRRISSSSGGVFEEIANLILQMNGNVYGAGFNKENKVEHMKAQNLEELENIKRSKYVQSDMNNIFEKINVDLKNGKYVLFSGTPCQVQAVKKYKATKTDKLITLDIVCHGVPSPKIFEDYKKYLEKEYDSKIISVNFRHKNEKSIQNIKIDFANGQSYISNRIDGDIFYNLFLEDIILRNSCYNCNFKSFDRIGDISLADFWGYAKGPAKDFGDNKGVSLVLINTEKGKEIFEKIKDNLECFEIQKDDCYSYNCFENFEIPEKYDEIWEKYMQNGFESLVGEI